VVARPAPLTASVRQMMRRATVFTLAALIATGVGVAGECTVLLVPPLCAQAVLLFPPIYQYLHIDLPSRRPLLVSDRRLLAKESDLNLPFPVRIVRGDDPKRAEAFEFTNAWPGEGDTVVVTFEFPPEGLVGQVTLRHAKGGWVVLARELREK